MFRWSSRETAWGIRIVDRKVRSHEVIRRIAHRNTLTRKSQEVKKNNCAMKTCWLFRVYCRDYARLPRYVGIIFIHHEYHEIQFLNNQYFMDSHRLVFSWLLSSCQIFLFTAACPQQKHLEIPLVTWNLSNFSGSWVNELKILYRVFWCFLVQSRPKNPVINRG